MRTQAIALLFISLALQTMARGQTAAGNASVSGLVVDPSSAPVAEAKVTLRDQTRGQSRATQTNEAGVYYFPAVLTGKYELQVTKAGFDPYTIQNIQITVAQAARFDVKLHIGAVSQKVEVGAEGDGVQLLDTSNQIGTVIDRDRVANLPLNGRSYLQLGLISAGVSLPRSSSDVISGQSGRSDRSVQINGAFQSETGYTVNGISVRGMRVGESALSVSVAAIDEFKVNMNFFMPDQGPNPGIVNVVTKSGTNQYHGETYEYLRNTKLNARNYFSPGAEQLNRNQFGFVLGGPVQAPRLFNGKNRVWFSANYEGERQISRSSSTAYAATARMMNGDFSGVSTVIYDPASFNVATGKRTAFAGNVISADKLNATTKKLYNYYLAGSTESATTNLQRYVANKYNDDQAGGRIDAVLGPRQTLSGSYYWQDSPITAGSMMPLTGANYQSAAKLVTLQHTFTISPALVTIARFGFDYSKLLLQGEASSKGALLDELGITGTPDKRGITGIGISGYAGLGRSAGTNGNVDNNYQADYGAVWNHGRMLVQSGLGLRYHRLRLQNANSNALGSLSFQPTFTAQLTASAAGGYASAAGTGNSFADFFLGYPTSGALLGLPPYYYRYWDLYPYADLTYRASSTLTVNAGLSWYHNTIPDPQGASRNVPHALNQSTGLLMYAALGQIDPKVLNTQTHTWTPRLGVSWQPTPKTVVRAGSGIYYGESFLFETQFAMNAPPYTNTRTFSNSNPSASYILGQNIFPAGSTAAVTGDYAANLASGYSPFALNPDGKLPMILQNSLSIQQSLTPRTMLEVTYLNNEGHHLQNRYDLDQCRPLNGVPCVYSARPWTRYNSVLYSSNDGNSNYNALMLRMQRRFAGNLTFVADYIYSKNIVDGWEGNGGTASQISWCRSCDRGVASINMPQRFVGSFVAPLPFGHGRRYGASTNRTLNALIGDWSVSGIVTLSSGSPFSVSAANNTASVFSDYRANRACGGADDNLASHLRGNGMHYFDTNCFSRPAAGYFGNSGRNILTGPGVTNFDLSLEKGLRLTESVRISLRGEFFNALNHANFANPDSTVGDTNFGVITAAGAPRLMQVSAKLAF
jgi:hypothetical protein